MDPAKVVSCFLLLAVVGIANAQDPIMNFVGYTNGPALVSGSGTCELISFATAPDLTENLYVGLVLTPLLDGTHEDEDSISRDANTYTPNAKTTASQITHDLYPEDTRAFYIDKTSYTSFRVVISSNRDISERVGVFYVGAILSGYRAGLSYIPIHSVDANVLPTQKAVTGSVGDASLTIEVETSETSLRWRKDGGTEISEWNDLTSVTITKVRQADEGVYECYVTGTRNQGLHAFIIVSIRSCPASKWSPPVCSSTCPVCYNDGVCDVELGTCLCPTGFSGVNCETSLGGNSFGSNGEITCTNKGGECSGRLFCGPYPRGCGCAPGWTGLDCRTECVSPKYGTDCRFTCNCADSHCDKSYGCSIGADCNPGFDGERCITPNIMECASGYYGTFCDLKCHCKNSVACDRNDGSCPENCEYGWAGSDCLIALPAFYDAPFVESLDSSVLVSWTAWDQSVDFGSGQVSSYNVIYWQNTFVNVTTTIFNVAENHLEIDMESLEYNQTYSVAVSANTDIDGVLTEGVPSPIITFGPLDPPSYNSSNHCSYDLLTNFSITVTCNTWNYQTDIGLGTIRSYIIEYWNIDYPDNVYNASHNQPAVAQDYTVLLPEINLFYHSYELVVRLSYKHNGTEFIGSPSPVLFIPKEKTPDMTGFVPTNQHNVEDNTNPQFRFYSGLTSGSNSNVSFGIRLWVDDTGTRFGENELNSIDGGVENSIFTMGTTFQGCDLISNSIKCTLTFPNSINVRRIGVKYMWTEFNGIYASTSAVYLSKHANIVPERRTISTSIGEAIDLIVSLDGLDASTLRWKKDGKSEIHDWKGLNSVSITNVRQTDGGIYECYQDGDREEGRHAITRVIVRECPNGKWFAPDCALDCPVCFNGGVCNERGLCICPSGFTGDNCEIACGVNNWGRDCSIVCSSSNPGCPGIFYCLPEPYGCSCFTGFEGIECTTECDTATTGKYGPDCLLDCHCDSEDCDRTNGCGLNVICNSGYTGTRCLERDQSVGCPDGFYGIQCTKKCHCENSVTCDRETGFCPSGDVCADAWAGKDCQQALPALIEAPVVGTFENHVNISWSEWSLDKDYGRGYVDSYQLLYWPQNDTSAITVVNATNGFEANVSWEQLNYHTWYDVSVLVVTEVEGELFIGEASPATSFIIDPPSLLRLPVLQSRGTQGINVTWEEWTYQNDFGIGNVTGYVIEWWDAVASNSVSSLKTNRDPVEGILIQNITYDVNLLVQISTIYVDGDDVSTSAPSPVLATLKDLCPYDWHVLDGNCYWFSENVVNWNDANSICENANALLVSITSQNENDFIIAASQCSPGNQSWIGLSTNTMQWHWKSGEQLLFQNWQGSAFTVEDNCATINLANGLWSNVACGQNNQYNVICEKGIKKYGCADGYWHGYDKKCYRHFNTLMSRGNAKKSCRQIRKADLVSLHSVDEDEFVQTIIRNQNEDSWIGLRNKSDDDIVWSDGSTVDYFNNIVTAADDTRECHVYTQDNYILSWERQTCSDENSYICKDIRGNIGILYKVTRMVSIKACSFQKG